MIIGKFVKMRTPQTKNSYKTGLCTLCSACTSLATTYLASLALRACAFGPTTLVAKYALINLIPIFPHGLWVITSRQSLLTQVAGMPASETKPIVPVFQSLRILQPM